MKLLKFDADDQDWIRLNSQEDFLRQFPPLKYGEYRPQPHMTPDRYPCYMQVVAFHYVSNGPDESVVAFIYDFDEGTEQEELVFTLKHS